MFDNLFFIFATCALLGVSAMYARMSLIVVYIFGGIIAGPPFLALVNDTQVLQEISNVGIIFLLFLLGMNLEPEDLVKLFKESTTVVVLSSMAFFVPGLIIALISGFNAVDSILVGAVCLFSSTIIVLKLIPTTQLHHKVMGEKLISIVLLQDLIAIALLLGINALATDKNLSLALLTSFMLLPIVIISSMFLSKRLLTPLLVAYDHIKEFSFLLIIAWCVIIAKISHDIGLSYEIGAFVAGVALASLPSARVMAEDLKPLRDFFLILFFFSIGASLSTEDFVNPSIIMPAVALAAAMLILKPWVFSHLLNSENMGLRLGQMSEFNLLVVNIAVASSVMSDRAASVITVATIFTFAVSSSLIVSFLPTPAASDKKLFKD